MAKKLAKLEKKAAKLTKKADKLMKKVNKKNNKNALVVEGTTSNSSLFDGKLRNYIGTGILQILAIALMAGIGAIGFAVDSTIGIVTVAIGALIGLAWATCIFYNWETKHTQVSGYKLKFNGKALQLLGNWIKWTFLTVITIGIYAFWLPVKVRAWRAKHTVAEAVQDENGYPQPQVTFYTYPQN